MEENKKSGFVTILGRPNVGKSTLLNKIIGRKISITSDKPQTTRNKILGVYTSDKGQIVFFDTPGVHRPGFELNRRMLKYVQAALSSVDLVLHMIDVGESFGHGEKYVIDMVKASKKDAILVLNKIDKYKKSIILEKIDLYRNEHNYLEYIPISALTGEGLVELVDTIYKYLPEGPFFYDKDFITDFPEKILIAELIREKVLKYVREEIPYSTGVLIDLYDDSQLEEKNLIRIEASILVEKDSQKGIIIGKGGKLIKKIGTEAREEIELLLGCRVYLGLFVKVNPNWRNNPIILDEMGLRL